MESRAYLTHSSSSVLSQSITNVTRVDQWLKRPKLQPFQAVTFLTRDTRKPQGGPDILGTVREKWSFCFALRKEAIGQTTLEAAGKLLFLTLMLRFCFLLLFFCLFFPLLSSLTFFSSFSKLQADLFFINTKYSHTHHDFQLHLSTPHPRATGRHHR